MLRKILLTTIIFALIPNAFAANKKDPTKTNIPMSTTAFLDQGALPVLYTCDGKDISPQLGWEKLPKNTKSLVIFLQDLNIKDKTFYHWVAFNIPASTTQLDQGIKALPKGSLLGKNSMDKASYSGPCPPKGSAHTYQFNIFALDTTLNLDKGATGEQVQTAMQGHILAEGKLSTVYSRWLK